MINNRDLNIQMIATVARRLGNLREKVVFVGGCATGLFVTDPAMPQVRVTKDVDVIIFLQQESKPLKGAAREIIWPVMTWKIL